MTTHGRMSPATVRLKVLELSGSHTCHEIADLLGITSMRTQRILDRLDDDAAGVAPGVEGLTVAEQQRPFLPVQRALHAGEREERRRDVCGTETGYQRHYADGEKPCEPCRLAKNAYQSDLYYNRKDDQ